MSEDKDETAVSLFAATRNVLAWLECRKERAEAEAPAVNGIPGGKEDADPFFAMRSSDTPGCSAHAASSSATRGSIPAHAAQKYPSEVLASQPTHELVSAAATETGGNLLRRPTGSPGEARSSGKLETHTSAKPTAKVSSVGQRSQRESVLVMLRFPDLKRKES